MDHFIFHGADREHEDLYSYAKDQALKSLRPRILEAALPGLSSINPTTVYHQSDVAGSKVTKPNSSVPNTESASSVEASEFFQYRRSVRNYLSDAHKASNIPRTVSNPSSNKFLQETLLRILSNHSISLF